MLSQAQRATILELHGQGVGKREIARLLKISRQSVRQVLQANSSAVPKIERAEKATPFLPRRKWSEPKAASPPHLGAARADSRPAIPFQLENAVGSSPA